MFFNLNNFETKCRGEAGLQHSWVLFCYCCLPVTQFPYYLFQKLSGRKISPVLRMFGQSISGGIDMDGNGYPGKLFSLKTYEINEDKSMR